MRGRKAPRSNIHTVIIRVYYTLIPFIVAGLCHLIGRVFENKVGFSASLRAVVGAGVQSGFVALVVCAILSFVSFNVAAVTNAGLSFGDE